VTSNVIRYWRFEQSGSAILQARLTVALVGSSEGLR
jgi:hypothetical protein